MAFQIYLLRQLPSYFGPKARQIQSVGPFTGQYATNSDCLLADAAHYGGFGVYLFVFQGLVLIETVRLRLLVLPWQSSS